MTPSKRAGGTVESEVDSSAETVVNGDRDPTGNGNGHGEHHDDDTPSKRRTTLVTNGVSMPERGSASNRGASSSLIAKPAGDDEAGSDVEAAASVNGDLEPPTILVPGEPVAGLPAPTVEAPAEQTDGEAEATGASSAIFDDAASSEPFGIPMPDDGMDVEPLSLPIVTVPPAARGSHPATLPEPVWMPTVPPDVPLEPPYVTTSMTAHNVAPVPRVVGRRPRVRKVTRVVRHVDPWSIFKIALLFNLVLYGVLLTAGVLLWNVAYATGTIDNLERFFESFGWSTFEFNGGAIYHAAWIAGLFGVIGLTGAAVLAATLFNLITDLVGGVRMTVLEEEVVERTSSPMRRFVVRRPTAPPVDADPPAPDAGTTESVDTSAS